MSTVAETIRRIQAKQEQKAREQAAAPPEPPEVSVQPLPAAPVAPPNPPPAPDDSPSSVVARIQARQQQKAQAAPAPAAPPAQFGAPAFAPPSGGLTPPPPSAAPPTVAPRPPASHAGPNGLGYAAGGAAPAPLTPEAWKARDAALAREIKAQQAQAAKLKPNPKIAAELKRQRQSIDQQSGALKAAAAQLDAELKQFQQAGQALSQELADWKALPAPTTAEEAAAREVQRQDLNARLAAQQALQNPLNARLQQQRQNSEAFNRLVQEYNARAPQGQPDPAAVAQYNAGLAPLQARLQQHDTERQQLQRQQAKAQRDRAPEVQRVAVLKSIDAEIAKLEALSAEYQRRINRALHIEQKPWNSPEVQRLVRPIRGTDQEFQAAKARKLAWPEGSLNARVTALKAERDKLSGAAAEAAARQKIADRTVNFGGVPSVMPPGLAGDAAVGVGKVYDALRATPIIGARIKEAEPLARVITSLTPASKQLKAVEQKQQDAAAQAGARAAVERFHRQYAREVDPVTAPPGTPLSIGEIKNSKFRLQATDPLEAFEALAADLRQRGFEAGVAKDKRGPIGVRVRPLKRDPSMPFNQPIPWTLIPADRRAGNIIQQTLKGQWGEILRDAPAYLEIGKQAIGSTFAPFTTTGGQRNEKRAAEAQQRVDFAQANLPQPGSAAYKAALKDGSLQKARAFHQKWFPPVQGYGDYAADETRRTIRNPEFQRELAALPAKARTFAESLSISQLVRNGISTDPERGTAVAEGVVEDLALWALLKKPAAAAETRAVALGERLAGKEASTAALARGNLGTIREAGIKALPKEAAIRGLRQTGPGAVYTGGFSGAGAFAEEKPEEFLDRFTAGVQSGAAGSFFAGALLPKLANASPARQFLQENGNEGWEEGLQTVFEAVQKGEHDPGRLAQLFLGAATLGVAFSGARSAFDAATGQPSYQSQPPPVTPELHRTVATAIAQALEETTAETHRQNAPRLPGYTPRPAVPAVAPVPPPAPAPTAPPLTPGDSVTVLKADGTPRKRPGTVARVDAETGLVTLSGEKTALPLDRVQPVAEPVATPVAPAPKVPPEAPALAPGAFSAFREQVRAEDATLFAPRPVTPVETAPPMASQPEAPAPRRIAVAPTAESPAAEVSVLQSPQELGPNMVFRDVRDFDGNALGIVAVPYDGTELGARTAALILNAAATPEHFGEQVSNATSRTAATDENGAPKWVVSPNRESVTPIAEGRSSAKPTRPALPAPVQDLAAGKTSAASVPAPTDRAAFIDAVAETPQQSAPEKPARKLSRAQAQEMAYAQVTERYRQQIAAHPGQEIYTSPQIQEEAGGHSFLIPTGSILERLGATSGQKGANYWQLPSGKAKQATAGKTSTPPTITPAVDVREQAAAQQPWKRANPPQVAQPTVLGSQPVTLPNGAKARGKSYAIPGFEEYQLVTLAPVGNKAQGTKRGWRVVEATTGQELHHDTPTESTTEARALEFAIKKLNARGKEKLDRALAAFTPEATAPATPTTPRAATAAATTGELRGKGSSKSVRDHTQSASVQGDTITITSKVGARQAGKITLPVQEWADAHGFGNPNYSKRELVRKATAAMDDEPGGPEQADRIRDAMVSAIDAAFRDAGIDPATLPRTRGTATRLTPELRPTTPANVPTKSADAPDMPKSAPKTGTSAPAKPTAPTLERGASTPEVHAKAEAALAFFRQAAGVDAENVLKQQDQPSAAKVLEHGLALAHHFLMNGKQSWGDFDTSLRGVLPEAFHRKVRSWYEAARYDDDFAAYHAQMTPAAEIDAAGQIIAPANKSEAAPITAADLKSQLKAIPQTFNDGTRGFRVHTPDGATYPSTEATPEAAIEAVWVKHGKNIQEDARDMRGKPTAKQPAPQTQDAGTRESKASDPDAARPTAERNGKLITLTFPKGNQPKGAAKELKAAGFSWRNGRWEAATTMERWQLAKRFAGEPKAAKSATAVAEPVTATSPVTKTAAPKFSVGDRVRWKFNEEYVEGTLERNADAESQYARVRVDGESDYRQPRPEWLEPAPKQAAPQSDNPHRNAIAAINALVAESGLSARMQEYLRTNYTKDLGKSESDAQVIIRLKKVIASTQQQTATTTAPAALPSTESAPKPRQEATRGESTEGDAGRGRAGRVEALEGAPAAEARPPSTAEQKAWKVREDNILRQADRILAPEQGPRRNTDTEAFRRWFGDSKVVDEGGAPLVVYHGTSSPEAIEAFRGKNHSVPSFFTDSAGYASKYGYEGTVYPVYLSIQKPLDMRGDGDLLDRVPESLWRQLTPLEKENLRRYRDAAQDDAVTWPAGEILFNIARNHGYDGVIWAEGDQGAASAFIPLAPTQIKSIFNQGTFDPSDSNILRQEARGKREKRGKSPASPAPFTATEIDVLAKLGAIHFAEGKTAFADWAGDRLAQVRADYGPAAEARVRAALPELWDASRKHYATDAFRKLAATEIPDLPAVTDEDRALIDAVQGGASLVRNRGELVAALREHFRYDAAEAEYTTAVTAEPFAKYWSSVTGRDASDFYRTRLGAVGSGESGSDRGTTVFLKDLRAIVRALKHANASTGVHELAHAFFPELIRTARDSGDAEMTADVEAFERWTGLEPGELLTLHEQWVNGDLRRGTKTGDRYIAAMEKIARGYERYLAEGKAPTAALKLAFDAFKKWLLEIYKQVATGDLRVKLKGSEIDVKLTPAAKAFFARVLGADAATLDKLRGKSERNKRNGQAGTGLRAEPGRRRTEPVSEAGETGAPLAEAPEPAVGERVRGGSGGAAERDADAGPGADPVEPPGASIKNAAAALIREAAGLDAFIRPTPQTMRGWADAALARKLPERALKLAQSVQDGKQAILTPEESVGMAIKLESLDAERQAAAAEFRAAQGTETEGDAAERLAEIIDQIDLLTLATNQAGTEAARALVARRAYADQYGYTGVYAAVRKELGEKLSPEWESTIADLTERNESLTADVARLEANAKQRERRRNARRAQPVLDRAKPTAGRKVRTASEIQAARQSALARAMERLGLTGEPTLFQADGEEAYRFAPIAEDVREIARGFVESGVTDAEQVGENVARLFTRNGIPMTDAEALAVIAGVVTQPGRGSKPKSPWQEVQTAAGQTSGTAAARLQKSLRAYSGKLDNARKGIFPPSPRTAAEVDPDSDLYETYLQREVVRRELDGLRARAQREAEWRGYSRLQKAYVITSDLFHGAPRSLVASGDLSALGQQGAVALFTDPKAWLSAWGPQLRAATHAGFERVAASVRLHPEYARMQVGGLELPSEDLNPGEEQFVSRLLEGLGKDDVSVRKLHQLPAQLVGKSQRFSMRTYAAALTTLRARMFADWVALAEADGESLSVAGLKQIGDAVNTFTGRGAKYLAGAEPLTKPFFALRYRFSKLEQAFGVPLGKALWHWQSTGEAGPAKVIGRKYLRALAMQAAFLGIAAAALEAFGPEDENGKKLARVELNPLAVDFGRLIVRRGNSNVVMPLSSPMFQALGLSLRILTQVHIGADGKQRAGAFSATQDIGSWVTSGLSPLLSTSYSLISAHWNEEKEAFGKKLDLTTAEGAGNAALRFTPISAQKALEIVRASDLSLPEKVAYSAAVIAQDISVREGRATPTLPEDVERELKRVGVQPHQPSRDVTLGNRKVKVPDELWGDYQQDRRDEVAAAVQKTLGTPSYAKKTLEKQQASLASGIERAENEAIAQVKGRMRFTQETQRLRLRLTLPADPDARARLFEKLEARMAKRLYQQSSDAEKRRRLEQWVTESQGR